jgi:hypothetical protein
MKGYEYGMFHKNRNWIRNQNTLISMELLLLQLLSEISFVLCTCSRKRSTNWLLSLLMLNAQLNLTASTYCCLSIRPSTKSARRKKISLHRNWPENQRNKFLLTKKLSRLDWEKNKANFRYHTRYFICKTHGSKQLYSYVVLRNKSKKL